MTHESNLDSVRKEQSNTKSTSKSDDMIVCDWYIFHRYSGKKFGCWEPTNHEESFRYSIKIHTRMVYRTFFTTFYEIGVKMNFLSRDEGSQKQVCKFKIKKMHFRVWLRNVPAFQARYSWFIRINKFLPSNSTDAHQLISRTEIGSISIKLMSQCLTWLS